MKPNNFLSGIAMAFMFHSGLWIGFKYNLCGGIMFGIAIAIWVFSMCLEKQIKQKGSDGK